MTIITERRLKRAHTANVQRLARWLGIHPLHADNPNLRAMVFLRVRYPWGALLLLVLGCAPEPSELGDGYTGALCGYTETDDSPRVRTAEGCAVLRATEGGLLTPSSAGACDVATVGTRCMVVQQGEGWRSWTAIESAAEWQVQVSEGCEVGCE